MRARLRLEPGDDLLAKLRAFVVERQIDAAVVLTCVGSTATTTLRPAAAAAPKVFEGAHDIVSLTGTIGRAGHNPPPLSCATRSAASSEATRWRAASCAPPRSPRVRRRPPPPPVCAALPPSSTPPRPRPRPSLSIPPPPSPSSTRPAHPRPRMPALRSLIDGVAFVRRHDARTGHTELSIEAANGRRAPSGASTTALVPAGAPPPKRRKTDAEHLIDYLCPVCGRNGVTAVDKETSEVQGARRPQGCQGRRLGAAGHVARQGGVVHLPCGIGPAPPARRARPPTRSATTPSRSARPLPPRRHPRRRRRRRRPALSLGGSPGDFGGVGGGGAAYFSRPRRRRRRSAPSPLGVASMAAPDEPEAVKGLLEAANSPIYRRQEG